MLLLRFTAFTVESPPVSPPIGFERPRFTPYTLPWTPSVITTILETQKWKVTRWERTTNILKTSFTTCIGLAHRFFF
jgi:hypothetical protein